MDEYKWHRIITGESSPKRRRNIEQLTKSYVDLVAEAISSTSTKTMTVGDICAYVKIRYGSGKSETTLKVRRVIGGGEWGQSGFFLNTVRHTLSCYSIFKKVRKEEYNRPALWTVQQEDYLQQDNFRSDGPSTSSESQSRPLATAVVTSTFYIKGFTPITRFTRPISLSCPISLNDDTDEDFPEPSAARYSIPIALDKAP